MYDKIWDGHFVHLVVKASVHLPNCGYSMQFYDR